MRLSDYIIDTRYQLRDAQGGFFTPQMVKRWINQARQQIALQTGCIRVLLCGASPVGGSSQPGLFVPGGAIPGSLPGNVTGLATAPNTSANLFQGIPFQEMYSFQWANKFLRLQYQGVQAIGDIIDLSIAWGGSTIRPTMLWMPWEDFQAYLRSYNNGVTSWPTVWASNGDGQNQNVWLYPAPSQPCEMEWDVTCVPSALNSDDDYDAIPAPYQNAVQYWAAYKGLLPTRPAQARIMHDQFEQNLGTDQAASDRGKTPDPYWQNDL